MTVPSFPQVVNTTTVETSMTDADLAVALHFARNGSPEGHRVEALETYIAALKEVVANAKEQSAANDKLPAELDNLRAGINAYWQQVVRNLCS
jgi:hypothetical protein